jgi:hypothetical protein
MALSATLQGIVAQDLCTYTRRTYIERSGDNITTYFQNFPPLFGNTSVHVVLLNEDHETQGPDFRGTFLCNTDYVSNGDGRNKLANDIYFSERGKSLVHATNGSGKTMQTLLEEHTSLRGRISVKNGYEVEHLLPLVVLNTDKIAWDPQSTLAQQLAPWQNAYAKEYLYTCHYSTYSHNLTAKPRLILFLVATRTWPGLDLNANAYSVQDYRGDPLIQLAHSEYRQKHDVYNHDLAVNCRRGVEQMCRNALAAWTRGQHTTTVETHALAKITETAKATLQATLLDVRQHLNAVSALNTFVQNLTRGNADVTALREQRATVEAETQVGLGDVGEFYAEAETQTEIGKVDPLFGVAEKVAQGTEDENQRATKRPRSEPLQRLWTLPRGLTKLI